MLTAYHVVFNDIIAKVQSTDFSGCNSGALKKIQCVSKITLQLAPASIERRDSLSSLFNMILACSKSAGA